MTDLTQEQWQTQLNNDTNAVILDVRTQAELDEVGYIPNAIHLDLYNPPAFVESIQNIDKARSIYVYCKSGGRSVQACAVLQQYGFKNTYNLLGGFSAWQGKIIQTQ